ncbi:MAG: cysteine desulfurase family protein [Candidatus Undinarchaeales archaeon]
MTERKVYLDHAASTPTAPEVIEEMEPYFTDKYGNASALHSFGREAKEALEKSREKILKKSGAKNHKLIFTSGGTESNNFALKGLAFREKKGQIITTKIEHDCILNSAKWLEGRGFDVTYLPVDENGFVKPEDLESAIQDDTFLVSIIHGNNEIGTIQKIKELGKVCSENEVPLHTDACQSFTKVPINMKRDNIDLMTINAHKIHGPKGVGALIIKEGIDIEPLMHGGGHEYKLRSGTQNVAGAVGFAKATEVMDKKDIKKMRNLRDALIEGQLEIDDTILNGPEGKDRLPNNSNVSFKFIEGESLLLHLDAKGIAASTGSACSSKSLEPSHVLTAIGLPAEIAHGSIRLSLSKYNTEEEIEYTTASMKEAVKNLRKISPMKGGN